MLIRSAVEFSSTVNKEVPKLVVPNVSNIKIKGNKVINENEKNAGDHILENFILCGLESGLWNFQTKYVNINPAWTIKIVGKSFTDGGIKYQSTAIFIILTENKNANTVL